MERIRRDVYNLLTVLFVGAIVAAGSIVVFRTTLPQDLPLSEDGFYEIYTAYDYERFWRKGGTFTGADQEVCQGSLWI